MLETAHREGQVTPKPGADPLPVSSWAVAALRLLLFTGARSSEVLTCQWDYVDVAGACLRLPDSKTGAKRIPLNAPALAVVQALPRIEGNAYVFPSLARQRGHLVKLHPAWATIRSAAGLADVRIHDLRHAHASIGVSAGLSLPVVGKCAHAGSSAWRSRSPATDARYPSAPTPTPSWPAVVRGSDRLRFRHEELVRLLDGVAGRPAPREGRRLPVPRPAAHVRLVARPARPVAEGSAGRARPPHPGDDLRYSHLAPEHLRAAVAVLDDVLPAGAQAGHKLQRVTGASQTIPA